jgi:hypothetical protein
MLPSLRRGLAALTLLLSPILALDGHASGPVVLQPRAVVVQGASPLESRMLHRPAVLRLVVCRKPVPYCSFPERADALNFLGAYVVETLECGHQMPVYFNPPLESLIAKRRRCKACDDAEKVIDITAGRKKLPKSVGIPAAERKAALI